MKPSRKSAEVPADTPEQLIAGLHNLLDEAEHMVVINGHAARDGVANSARRLSDTVREHPLKSLALAAGVGVLLGAWLRRSR